MINGIMVDARAIRVPGSEPRQNGVSNAFVGRWWTLLIFEKTGDFMDHSSLLVIAMAEECRRIIVNWPDRDLDLPESIRRAHLERMCERIEKHSEDWPATRLHRWIGFIQCALIANRVIDLAEAKRMFDRAKIAYPEADDDLLDHLNPSDFFEIDLGGLE